MGKLSVDYEKVITTAPASGTGAVVWVESDYPVLTVCVRTGATAEYFREVLNSVLHEIARTAFTSVSFHICKQEYTSTIVELKALFSKRTMATNIETFL